MWNAQSERTNANSCCCVLWFLFVCGAIGASKEFFFCLEIFWFFALKRLTAAACTIGDHVNACNNAHFYCIDLDIPKISTNTSVCWELVCESLLFFYFLQFFCAWFMHIDLEIKELWTHVKKIFIMISFQLLFSPGVCVSHVTRNKSIYCFRLRWIAAMKFCGINTRHHNKCWKISLFPSFLFVCLWIRDYTAMSSQSIFCCHFLLYALHRH